MNAVSSEKEQPLLARIDEAQAEIEGLERNLHQIDSELEELAGLRERFELVDRACESLERLAELGAAELFWGEDVDRAEAARRVQAVRGRLDGFRERIAEIEARRETVVERIAEGREVLAILEDDLFEIRAEEEERLNEWVIERDVEVPAARVAPMPWTRGLEDDLRFRKSLGSSLAAALLLGMLLPFVDLPVPEPSELLDVPERVVELIRRERQLPPPPAAIIDESRAPDVQPEPEPEPVVPEEAPPPEPVLAEQPPVEAAPQTPTPGPAEEAPRQRAQSSGILAFRDSLSNLAENRPSARLGSSARISNAGDAAVGTPSRAMVTTLAPGSSGGINLASISRDVGGGGGEIAGVEAGRVASSIAAAGVPGGARVGSGAGGSSAAAGRTDEEIQIVFDRYKASLYRLYNRELRNNPTLRGQMVLRITIEPDGSVSLAELESTTMDAPLLVQQVLERVRTFDFGAKDVAPITILYPIDFLPAA